MADLKHHKVAFDPAFTRMMNVSANRYRYFRWTPKTAWLTFTLVCVVPSMFGVLAYSTDGKWDMRAKKRGDVISEY